MNTAQRIGNPVNVTRPGEPDTRIASAVTRNLKLADYRDAKSYKFTNQGLDGIVVNRRLLETKLQREFSKLKESPNNPLLLNRIGTIYFASKKFDKARRYFLKAFQQKMDYLDAALNLSRAYMLEGKPDKAEGVLNLIIDDTKSSFVLHEAAIVKLIMGKYVDALGVLDRISSQEPNHFEVVNTKGLIYLIQKDLTKAEKYFKDSIRVKTDYPSAHNNLAVVYKARGKLDLAIKSFQKALDLDANYIEAYGNLFQSYVDKKDFIAASKVIEKAQFLSPVEPELAFKYAWIVMTQQNFEEAIHRYHKFLSLRPNNGNALNNIGFCYAQLGNYDGALTAYEAACKYVKGHHLPHRNLMTLLTELGLHKRALHIAQQLRKIYENDPAVLTSIGAAYASEEKWDDAQELLEKAYAQRPALTHLYILLGFMYADIKPDYEKGKEILEYPLEKDFPKKDDVYNNLVHLQLVTERLDEAKKSVKHLRNLDNPVTLATYALFLLKTKGPAEAIKSYDRAIELAASDDFKDKVRQRKHFDLANHYLVAGDARQALAHLKETVAQKKGFNFISERASELIGNL